MKYILILIIITGVTYGVVSENTYCTSAAYAVYEQCAEMGVYPNVGIYPNDFGSMSYVVAYHDDFTVGKEDHVVIPIIVVGNISSQTTWESDILVILFNHCNYTITTTDCRYMYNNLQTLSANEFDSELASRLIYDDYGLLDIYE